MFLGRDKGILVESQGTEQKAVLGILMIISSIAIHSLCGVVQITN